MQKKLILIFLLTTCFWGINGLYTRYYEYMVNFILLLFMMKFYRKTPDFNRYLFPIYISIICSAISSMYYEGQSIALTLLASSYFLQLSYFYVLVSLNPSIYAINKFIGIIAVLTMTAYYLQLMIYPIPLFVGGAADWIGNSTQSNRFIYVIGKIFIPIGYFYYLNQYFETKNKKIVLLICLFIIVILVRGFRIMTFGTIVGSTMLYYRYYQSQQLYKKIMGILGYALFILILIIVIYNYIPIAQSSMDAMFKKLLGNEDNLSNDEYIRTLSINYFYTEYFKSNIELFFGSGVPHLTSKYGSYYIETIQHKYQFNYVDWGVIGLSWFVGIPCILFYLRLQIKCIISKLHKSYSYISSCFIYFIISSFTDPETYQHCAFIGQSTLFYLVYKYYKNNKETIFSNHPIIYETSHKKNQKSNHKIVSAKQRFNPHL